MLRNKAKLVCKVYAQAKGLDFDETFTLIARLGDIIMFSTFASQKKFKIQLMDVK